MLLNPTVPGSRQKNVFFDSKSFVTDSAHGGYPQFIRKPGGRKLTEKNFCDTNTVKTHTTNTNTILVF